MLYCGLKDKCPLVCRPLAMRVPDMGGGGEVWVRQYVCVRTSGPLVVTDGILRTIIILFTIFCCINYGIIYCSSIDWCH